MARRLKYWRRTVGRFPGPAAHHRDNRVRSEIDREAHTERLRRAEQFAHNRWISRAGYSLRFLMSLTASLLLIVMVARLPLYPAVHSLKEWTIDIDEPPVMPLFEVRSAPRVIDEPGAKLGDAEDPKPKEQVDEQAEPVAEAASAPAPAPEPAFVMRPIERVASLAPIPAFDQVSVDSVTSIRKDWMTLNTFAQDQVEQPPDGALRVRYPERARTAGIEGRLLLAFTVEMNGRASNIRVLQSLHPLCDAAAVLAVQQAQFIPGRHEGRKVRVQVELPIRFMLN